MQTQKSGYLLDRNVTPPGSVASFRTSPLSDYSNFHFFFFLFFLLASLDSSSLSYLSFFTYFPSSIPPFSSYLPFILCPSSHSSLLSPLCSQTNSLLDATWDTVSSPVPRFSLSLCFYASLSFRGPQAKPSPLPLSGCHRFLSTLIVPRTHYLSHTPKHKYNVLIFTYNMQHLDKMLF